MQKGEGEHGTSVADEDCFHGIEALCYFLYRPFLLRGDVETRDALPDSPDEVLWGLWAVGAVEEEGHVRLGTLGDSPDSADGGGRTGSEDSGTRGSKGTEQEQGRADWDTWSRGAGVGMAVMTAMMLHRDGGEWAVVCDGSLALFSKFVCSKWCGCLPSHRTPGRSHSNNEH
jgi:hypothetical protein